MPGSQRTRSRRPRGSLTRELIVAAAERVAERGDPLSIRTVASELDAAPMALYRHFATKDDLVNALLDGVLGRFAGSPPTDDWLADIRVFALEHRRLLDSHPWALDEFFAHPNPGPNAVRIGEKALAILRRGGIAGRHAVATFSGIIALNYGWSAFAAARRKGDADGVSAPTPALNPAAFPLTVEAAAEMADYASDRHYELALDAFVAGIAQSERSQ